jgi:hypothetical protein
MSDEQTLTIPFSYMEDILTREGIEVDHLLEYESVQIVEAKVDTVTALITLTVLIDEETLH